MLETILFILMILNAFMFVCNQYRFCTHKDIQFGVGAIIHLLLTILLTIPTVVTWSK